ncbi:MAG: glycoside hydrolase N-terminal domain-containing protein, partial [Rikenellaceae bacterium]
LEFDAAPNTVSNYLRGLDLEHSIGFVEYDKGNVHFNREYFCSYPDKVIALHLSADKQGSINTSISQDLLYHATSIQWEKGNELIAQGVITASGLKYCVRIKVLKQGGEISYKAGKITIAKANEATILYTVSTEYDAKSTNFKGANPFAETDKNMKIAASQSYETLKNKHISDYQALFGRVSFTLKGDAKLESLPTDQRVTQLKKGTIDDSALKTLYFNFGRYLLISASRPGTLPSTLHGVWNDKPKGSWSANYQSNINIQEMYWAAGSTQLTECQEAYIDWIEGLVEPGRKVAQAYYGTGGWVSHATGNIWKYASPGYDLLWGLYPTGSAWHCLHLWEQYAYTGNKKYLKEKAYPIMKEAAQFYLENLMEYEGKLVMTPSSSAEHGIEVVDGKPVEYTTRNGEDGTNMNYLYPSFQDIEMIHVLFTHVVAASKALNVDIDFRHKILSARNQLMPLKIGKYGQLQEWVIDADNPRDHHRHIAHIYGVYPADMITPFDTPELAAAAKKSLKMRGDGMMLDRWPHTGGGWSATWRIACWTRLLDGDHSIRIFNQLISDTGSGNLFTTQRDKMMVDSPMATPGLFAEMLMQSHREVIHLLPALPTEWPEGEIKGLQARGGYKINLRWKYGHLIQAEILVPQGMPVPKLRIEKEEVDEKDARIRILSI